MPQLPDFMGNDLKPGALYTYTYSYKSGGQTQYLLMFQEHMKARANFRHLSSNFSGNPLSIRYQKDNKCYLLSRILIKVTPEMLTPRLNVAITDWFRDYNRDNPSEVIDNEWAKYNI
jgi:hypothetical protein